MDIFQYTIKNADETVSELKVNPSEGLAEIEVKQRLEKYGKNELAFKPIRWQAIFLRQFKSPFIYLLLAAAALAFILHELIDAAMILLFILINAVLGFYQEFRSEKTLQLLRKYVSSLVKAMRNGEEIAINAEEIVPGDIIILETGDKIPADVRFLETHNFTADESVLTGESMSVKKTSDILINKADNYYQAINLGFAGTTVAAGKAKAIVLATGQFTSIGKIAKLEVEIRHVSGFEKGIARFSKFILKMVFITLAFVVSANFIFKEKPDLITLTIFSIALAVSVIPEALPVVTTFSLSRGALRLAKKKVVVKRLSAIEDLGGIEILCTDKTGTLTENCLSVSEIYPRSSEDAVLYANLAASALEKHRLEPFDIALHKRLAESGKDLRAFTRLADEPFDPVRKRNTALIKNNNQIELISRGAPEEIIKLCRLGAEEKKSIKRWIGSEGAQGKRVLAVAKKTISGVRRIEDIDLKNEENKLIFIGAISFADPIKSSAFKAVKQAGDLGVKIAVITGDSKEVAGAVAYKIGLVSSLKEVITADALEKMGIEEQGAAVLRYKVFARVSPEQKYKIIKLLQEKYNVGFLGEGINDAPALKIADVSLVVQSASDIAREAADIVLLKKNLEVILDGIREGREVFINTAKYIKATLASNFGNFFAVAAASLLIDFLPMLPIQLLLLNLLSDFPMIAISTDTVSQSEIKLPQKYSVKDMALIAAILGIISTIFDFIFFGVFYRLSPQILQTCWFLGSIVTELALIFSIRTKGFLLRAQKPSAAIIWMTVAAFAASLALPFTTVGRELFKFIKPQPSHIMAILAIAAVYLLCTEIIKLMYFKEEKTRNRVKGI